MQQAIALTRTANIKSAIKRVVAAATTNATLVRGAQVNLHSIYLYNNTAVVKFVKFYDKATAPTVGTDVPAFTMILPASGSLIINDPVGITFLLGLGYAITGAIADTDTTAVAANDVTGVLVVNA